MRGVCLLASMLLAAPVAPATLAQPAALSFAGRWAGNVEVPGQPLAVIVDLSTGADGGWVGSISIPAQMIQDFRLGGVVVSGTAATFEMKGIPGAPRFEGKLDPQGALTGTFVQGEARLPFRLEKRADVKFGAAATDWLAKERPQQPRRPFPYREEEITYLNSKIPGRLAGTLTLPADAAPPYPAVLLITGSGSQDRDETIFNHKPFLLIADQLTRRGIVVLRVDDRGVGASTAGSETLTSLDLAGDVEAGLAYLKSRRDIDGRRLGLLGHSEGGLIASIVASRSDDVAFLVLLAGTAVPGEQILYFQGGAILKAGGAGADAVAAQRRQQEGLFAIARQDLPSPEARANARAALRAEILSSVPAGLKDTPEVKARVEAQIDALLSPWFRFFLTYDPAPALERVKCPVLAMNGDKDTQVPGRLNLDTIRAALARGGNKNVDIQELPGLNHLFQTSSNGSPSEYGSIEETMSPTALRLIVEWVTKQAGLRR